MKRSDVLTRQCSQEIFHATIIFMGKQKSLLHDVCELRDVVVFLIVEWCAKNLMMEQRRPPGKIWRGKYTPGKPSNLGEVQVVSHDRPVNIPSRRLFKFTSEIQDSSQLCYFCRWRTNKGVLEKFSLLTELNSLLKFFIYWFFFFFQEIYYMQYSNYNCLKTCVQFQRQRYNFVHMSVKYTVLLVTNS